MRLSPLMQSLLTFLIRRGLTLLGSAGATVSDEWVAQTVSVLLIAGNEAFQWWQAHKKGVEKAETVKIAS